MYGAPDGRAQQGQQQQQQQQRHPAAASTSSRPSVAGGADGAHHHIPQHEAYPASATGAGVTDPLREFCSGEDTFNILNFITEEAQHGLHQHPPPPPSHHHHQHQHPHPHHHHQMSEMPQCIPQSVVSQSAAAKSTVDSPPVTDHLSAGMGSSASPVSDTESSSYSPDHFGLLTAAAAAGGNGGVVYAQQQSGRAAGAKQQQLLALQQQQQQQQRAAAAAAVRLPQTMAPPPSVAGSSTSSSNQQLATTIATSTGQPPSAAVAALLSPRLLPGSFAQPQISPVLPQTAVHQQAYQQQQQKQDIEMGGYPTDNGNPADGGAGGLYGGYVQQQQQPPRKRAHVDNTSSSGNGNSNENGGGAATSELAVLATDAPYYASTPAPLATPIPGGGGDFQDENNLLGHQLIKFSRFQEDSWTQLFDDAHQPLRRMNMHVVADKGFNYSHLDGCFVNQKKNHFQISVHIETCDDTAPTLVRLGGQWQRVVQFKLAFCGVKSEMLSSEILIKQSQTDRRPSPHEPVPLNIEARRMAKVTVPRLHFSETTLNNQRKNSRPNPDQKYFYLVVRLLGFSEDGHVFIVQSYNSERVVVRATNPGQFEPPDSELNWQKVGGALCCHGNVAIGTERALAPLTVAGDVFVSGNIQRASDVRLKEDIEDIDKASALDRLAKLRIVEYNYRPEVAAQLGLDETNRHRVGVIAQELQEVNPDAVRLNGDFLTVDESRVFYDTVVAAQELCRLTDNLDCKIDEKVDEIQRRLARWAKRRKQLGSLIASSTTTTVGGDLDDEPRSLFGGGTSSCVSVESAPAGVRYGRSGGGRGGKSSSSSHTESCSSRVTQLTVVLLVAVMALCLVAMSGLYMLDWYHRNQRNAYLNDFRPRNDNEPANIVKLSFDVPSNVPEAAYAAPMLDGFCTNATRCRQYCCSSASNADDPPRPNSIVDDSMTDEANDPSATTESSAGAAIVVAPSPHSAAVAAKGASLATNQVEPVLSSVRIELRDFNMTLDGRHCVENSCSNAHRRYVLFVPVSAHFPTMALRLHITPSSSSQIVTACGATPKFEHQMCGATTGFATESSESASSSSSSSQKELPVAADAAAAVNPAADEDRQQAPQPQVAQIAEHEFELSAGDWLQVAYQFRVGQSTDVCQDGQLLNSSFEEYNIVFFRVCNGRHQSTSKQLPH